MFQSAVCEMWSGLQQTPHLEVTEGEKGITDTDGQIWMDRDRQVYAQLDRQTTNIPKQIKKSTSH